MGILQIRNRIKRYRLGWSLAFLLVAVPTLGACAAVPMPAPAMDMAAMPAGTQQNMPASCCFSPNLAAHAVAIPASEATLQPFPQTPRHEVVATAAFSVQNIKSTRLLRPPIRAPAASSRPLYLLDCALLN